MQSSQSLTFSQSNAQSPQLDFNSLISVTLDVNVIQESLSRALQDIHLKISSLSDRTLIIENNCSDQFKGFDQKMAQICERMDFLHETVDRNEQQYIMEFESLQKYFQKLGNSRDTNLKGIMKDNQNQTQNQNQNQNQNSNPLGNKAKLHYAKPRKEVISNKNSNDGSETNNPSKNNANENKIQSKIFSLPSGDLQSQKGFPEYSVNGRSRASSGMAEEDYFKMIEEQLDQKYLNWTSSIREEMLKEMKTFKNILFYLRQELDQKGNLSSRQSPLFKKKSQQTIKEDGMAADLENQNYYDFYDKENSETDLKQKESTKKIVNMCLEDYLENYSEEINKKMNLYVTVNSMEQVKTEIFAKITLMEQLHGAKIENSTKTNSIMADHLLALKTKVQELRIKESDNQRECKNLNEKIVGIQSQLFLSKQGIKSGKQHLSELATKVSKLELVNGLKSGEMNQSSKEEEESGSGNSKRGSALLNHVNNANDKRSSSRLSGLTNLPPNGENIEDLVRKINVKVINLTERLNRIEDSNKANGRDSKNNFLPKIQGGSRNSNVQSYDVIRLQLKKLNESLFLTNQHLDATKLKLTQLYDSHNLLPLQIEDLYTKLREHNEFQEDRLLQLIKQLINRCLTDPFNNNFTNTLKRQINVKFLEIKHEYYGILKEIEHKVENRAQGKQLTKVREALQEGLLQVKSIVNKKCDGEDLKKGLKYLEVKIKEVYGIVRAEVQGNAERNDSKCYVTLKKSH